MREASNRRTVTDTDSYAFLVYIPIDANEWMTAAINNIMTGSRKSAEPKSGRVRFSTALVDYRAVQPFQRMVIFIAVLISCFPVAAEKIYYQDKERRIIFALDTDTREATVGTGDTGIDESALLKPQYGTPEYEEHYWEVWNNVAIPETIVYGDETYTVTSVAANAFYKCTYIKHLSLPNTIRTIDINAFGYCVNLEDFEFPTELRAVSAGAFQLCRTLTKLILPEKLSSIGAGAFHDCTAAEELYIPGSCTSISDEAFNWCVSLEKITIADGPEPLEMGYCFEKGISYEGTASYCMRGMFGDVKRLKEVHWGRNLILPSHSDGRIYAPFYYIANFYTNTSGAKVNSTVGIDKLTFGEYVTEIPRNAFERGSITQALVFPASLERIGDYAFNSTFLENTKVLKLPVSLEFIGQSAFEGPNGTEFVIIESEAIQPPSTLWSEETRVGYPFLPQNGLLIKVPAGAGAAYRNDSFWGKFAIADPDDKIITVNVKKAGSFYGRLIAQGAQIETTQRLKLLGELNSDDWATIKKMDLLYDLDLKDVSIGTISKDMVPSNISNITLPQNLQELGESALCGRPLTGTLEIPASCTKIGNSAVSQTLIDNLIIPSNGIEIEESAFRGLKNIKELKLSYVNIIGDDAFGYSSYEKVSFGEGCNITGSGAFSGCEGLETIVIDGTVKNLGAETFRFYGAKEECNIKNIIFNGCVLESGANIFFNETLPGVNPVPESYPIWRLEIKDLEGYVKSHFAGLSSSPMNYASEVNYNGVPLTSVSIPEGVTNVFDAMFRNCKSLRTVLLPSTIKSIGVAAFENCSIEEITFPDALATIGRDAFKGCSSIEKLNIPKSVAAINAGAFYNCESLKNVYAYYSEPVMLSKTSDYYDDLPFNKVDSECCLYVPIGTANKYREANWIFPNIQEVGTLSITIKGEGKIVYEGNAIYEGTSIFSFKPYVPFELSFEPKEGLAIKSVLLNGEYITDCVIDNKLIFEDPDVDIDITVTFSEPFSIGDSNGDGDINIADAVNTANYIIGLPTTSFNFAAADVNKDEHISVSDVTATITIVQRQSYSQPTTGGKPVKAASMGSLLSCMNVGNGKYDFSVDGETDLTALQFDIRIGVNCDIPAISLPESIAKTHTLTVGRVEGSTLRVILFSPQSSILPQNQTLLVLDTDKDIVPDCTNIFASNVIGQSESLRFNARMSGLSDISTGNMDAKALDGQIVILNGIVGQEITVIDLFGKLITRTRATDATVCIDVCPGVYIVRVGAKVVKLFVK